MSIQMAQHIAGEHPITDIDLDLLNERFETESAESVITWAIDTFGNGLVMTSSFGAQAAVMLHLAYSMLPRLPVILIDTGYLFPETYRFIQELTDKLDLNLKVYTPRITTGWLEAIHGQLWNQGRPGLDEYHRIVKIEPLQRALKKLNATAWLAGLRRSQTNFRATLRYVQRHNSIYKIHPVLNWSNQDIHHYLKLHNLPYHPLVDQGYASIGDIHLSQPVRTGQHERQGRFKGMKQECGIHIPQSEAERKSRDSSGL